MPQEHLTQVEADQIAAGVAAALAPAFDKIAAALAPPPKLPAAVPAPPVPAPAVQAAPAVPRSLAELQEENHFLRSIAGQVEERLARATPGSTSMAIAPSLERIALARPATLAALEEENGFLHKVVEHLLKQLERAQGGPR